MDARRATKVVAGTTKPRSATPQTPYFAATRRDGAFRAVCIVARLAKGGGHWLRLASRIPSRKAAVATAWDLIRGSLSKQFSQFDAGIGRAHERLADQKTIDPVRAQQLHILRFQDSAFGNHDALTWNQIEEL